MEKLADYLLQASISIVAGAISAYIAVKMTLHASRERVKRLDECGLYVEISAIEVRNKACIIPGWGTFDVEPEELRRMQRKYRNRVAFVCYNVTELGDTQPRWVPAREIPL